MIAYSSYAGCGLNMMEKYYCDNCRLLYNEEGNCTACGTLVKNKLVIEVHKQNSSKNHAEPE